MTSALDLLKKHPESNDYLDVDLLLMRMKIRCAPLLGQDIFSVTRDEALEYISAIETLCSVIYYLERMPNPSQKEVNKHG